MISIFFKVGLLTDLGHITPHIRSNYQNLDAVLIEYNHDFQMLQTGRYPAKLKARVGGIDINDEKTYKFTINRPWYLSNTMIIIYAFSISV